MNGITLGFIALAVGIAYLIGLSVFLMKDDFK